MNYLKKFESFQTHDEIHKICEKYNIKNYTINSDGSIDVDDDVWFNENLSRLPLKFNDVKYNFDCTNNNLTTLEGAPKYVGGYFSCKKNNLTTLKGSPKEIFGFFDCSNNNLTTLEGAPDYIDLYFDFSNNRELRSFDGCPLTSFEYCIYNNTPIEEILKLFNLTDDKELFNSLTTAMNYFQIIEGDKIYIEDFNDLILKSLHMSPVENVKGYKNIYI